MDDPSQLYEVLAHLPVGVFWVEPEGTIAYANEFANQHIFGEPVVGADFDATVERFHIRGESLSSVLETELADDQLLLSIEREKVRSYYSLTVVGPRHNEHNVTVFLLQEASSLVGLGEWLSRMASRAAGGQSTLGLVQRLAQEVAILVRNPLAAMTINAALLTRSDGGSFNRQELAEDIEDAAARIADAVDRLVSFGRIGVKDPNSPLILDAIP